MRLSRAFHGCGLASPFVWYHSIATTFQAAVPPPTISTSMHRHHHHHHHLHARGAAARRGRCASCPTAHGARRFTHSAWCEAIHPQRMVRDDSPTPQRARGGGRGRGRLRERTCTRPLQSARHLPLRPRLHLHLLLTRPSLVHLLRAREELGARRGRRPLAVVVKGVRGQDLARRAPGPKGGAFVIGGRGKGGLRRRKRRKRRFQRCAPLGRVRRVVWVQRA